VRTNEGVDVWPLRARSIAVEAAAADVPDNRPLSGGRAVLAVAARHYGWVRDRAPEVARLG
jgi:hypothetical protein